MIKFFTSFLLLFSLSIYDVYAQSYKKDSLQFKVYTRATFKNSKLKAIKLHRVFCDYCSDSQLKVLGQLGLKQSNIFVKQPKNRLINGEKRLTLYIRIRKKDFANIKLNDTIK